MAESMIDSDVVREQYHDTAHLAARQRLWPFRSGPSLLDTVLHRAALRGTEVVVDVGCGNGAYLAELRRRGHGGPVLGLDLSVGMARASRAHAATAVADAQALPLRDGCVDVALCLHMLYHVPDLPRAARELRRVVRPGGLTVVATNNAGHTVEAKAVLAQAAARVTGFDVGLAWDTRRVGVDAARQLLASVFDDVDVHDLSGSFSVPEPAIVSGYIASLPPESVGLHAGPSWSAVLAEVERLVAVHFKAHASFQITGRTAVLVGR